MLETPASLAACLDSARHGPWLMATGNAHKAEEISEGLKALGLSVAVSVPEKAAMEGLEENADTFKANAQLKAQWLKQYAKEQGLPWVLADDSGLVLDALRGHYGLPEFPGLHSNRWLTPERYEALWGQPPEASITNTDKVNALLRLLGNQPAENRFGAFVCALCLLHVPTGEALVVEGRCPIQVVSGLPRGAHGFGYDPLALPVDPSSGQVGEKTIAELLPREKQALSHRALALRALVNQLAKA